MGRVIPLFSISGDVCPGFQNQGGSNRLWVSPVVSNRFLRFNSGAAPADLFNITSLFPTLCLYALYAERSVNMSIKKYKQPFQELNIIGKTIHQ